MNLDLFLESDIVKNKIKKLYLYWIFCYMGPKSVVCCFFESHGEAMVL